MPAYARIDGGAVAEVIFRDDGFDVARAFHPSLVWVACDDDVEPGWTHDEDAEPAFAPPPPAPPPPPFTPPFVSNYHMRAALIASAQFAAVDAHLRGLGAASLAFQAWEYANRIHRASALALEIAAAIGASPQQLDALFVAASEIV